MITIRLREASVSYLRVLAPLRKKREGEAIELLAGVTDGRYECSFIISALHRHMQMWLRAFGPS